MYGGHLIGLDAARTSEALQALRRGELVAEGPECLTGPTDIPF